MAPSATAAIPPVELRVIRAIKGKSLIVAIPQKLSLVKTSNVASSLPTYDRAFWRKFSYTPLLLKISTIIRSLGLRQSNSGPGKTQFQHRDVIQFADAASEVIQRLPGTLEELLDVAADYGHALLQQEVTLLLDRFGDELWGAGKKRPWLLQAIEGYTEYPNNLVFDSAADREV